MKVAVIGGGPGGLYFALLAKKAWPRWDITVYERNRPDDTFGFGVVFSDQTLDSFKAYDTVTYERIRRRFAYWGDCRRGLQGRDAALRAATASAAARATRCSTSSRTAAASSACRCASSAKSRGWRNSPTRI
jgi:anthraniloyl-CoA monooxygenase